MKRISIILFMVLTYSYTYAQQPAICGDWTGIYESSIISDDVDEEGDKYFVTKDFKRIIRIKQTEGQYTVRMKIQRADGTGSVSYIPNAQIINASDTHIFWKHDRGNEYDWSPSAKHNGRTIGHAAYTYYCSVTLHNGALNYSEYWITTYYDKQGYRIDDQKWGEHSYNLYKDEEDW